MLKYNNSPSQLLSSVYPELNWLPWRFSKRHLNQSDHVNKEKQFVDSLANTLKIKEFSDWYEISPKVLKKMK